MEKLREIDKGANRDIVQGKEWASMCHRDLPIFTESKKYSIGTNGICAFLRDHEIQLTGKSNVTGTEYEI
jgi:hypothetical protein